MAWTELRRLRAPLLRWYRRNRRDLPWRRSTDPYAIWVAEVMLQQTQVATVIPYYERFLRRFPDAASLARAPVEEVLAHWSGLGYYRRARALRDGARAVVERHGGRLPADHRALLELPGIGRYTAGAVASIAFSLAEPVLDGNVRRVFSRLFALRDPGDRMLWELAGQLVDGPHPGDLNQALMELGATTCTPRQPACAACPVASRCQARAAGDPQLFPEARRSRRSESVAVAVAWIDSPHGLLVEQPGDDSPFRGMWDLPALEIARETEQAAQLRTVLRDRHGLDVDVREQIAAATHGIMHRRLKLSVFDCRLRRGRVRGRRRIRWIDSAAIDRSAVSGATQKIARKLVPSTNPGAKTPLRA